MAILSKFKKTADIEDAKEFVGGTYYVPETGVYQYTITKAYMDESAGGSLCVKLELTSAEHTFNPAIYFTTRKEKGQDIYFMDKNKKKQYLPSFLLIDSLCEILTGKGIGEQETEEKMVKVYDYDAKKDISVKRDVLIDLVGQDISVALQKTLEDKYSNPKQSTQKLEIEKFFDVETGRTSQEIEGELDVADFKTKWLEKNKGNTIDNRQISLQVSEPEADRDDPFDSDDEAFSEDETVVAIDKKKKDSKAAEVTDAVAEVDEAEEEDVFG